VSESNRQWILKKRPEGAVRDSDIVLETGAIPKPAEGEIVIRTLWLSLDPANRAWMNETPTYMDPVPVGGPMYGLAMGEVVESASDRFSLGDRVVGLGRWAEYAAVPADAFQPLPDMPGIPGRDVFGVFYLVGPTAYFGIHDICEPRAGETVVVSGAAGAVGSIAGQLAKAAGARVIGIAGGEQKCGWVTDNYGIDGAIDYKNEDVGERLDALCPEGVDCFFDNVGGSILDEVLGRMNNFGRVAQCGAISMYNADAPQPGPYNYLNIVVRRIKIQGFIVLDHIDRYPEAYEHMAGLRSQGKLNWKLEEDEGIESLLSAFRKLFSGENAGKMMVRVAA